jgi:hypothetical protein
MGAILSDQISAAIFSGREERVRPNLYSRVNGVGLSMNDSRAIDRKCADALWNSCTFKINY